MGKEEQKERNKMPSFNKVILIGNLTKDPELRYTAGGAAVANIRLASNRKYKSKGGDIKEDVCFVTMVVWNKLAETVTEYVKKGHPILVEGRLQSRSWETDDKQKKSIIEVVAESIQFLKGKGEASGEEPAETFTVQETTPMADEDIPF